MLAKQEAMVKIVDPKNITPTLKDKIIAKQNNIRFRILACISLCDKIFSQVRNDVYPELKSRGDIFGKKDFLDSLNEKLPEDQIKFFNEIRYKFFININRKNFEDIFIKINVLRNWLVHHILEDDKNNNQDKNQKINDQNYQNLVKKFEIERNKFSRANFNFNSDLIDENILKNLSENLEGALFKILPQDLCNQIYNQFWDFKKLLNDNQKEPEFKDSKFKKNLDNLKKEKKDFITKNNSKLQKDKELLEEINQLKFIFKNKQKNKSNGSAPRKSKHKNQGKLTIDATNYVFIGKENYDIIKKQIMIRHHQIKDIKIDEEKKPKKSAEFINKYNQKTQQDHQKSFEEINKIYLFALEINILFRVYFTDKVNELEDLFDCADEKNKSLKNYLQTKQKKIKPLNRMDKSKISEEQKKEIYNLNQEISKTKQQIKIIEDFLKNFKVYKKLRNAIDHSQILQILLSQDKQNPPIAENFSNNLQIAIDFIEKYHHQNSDKIAKEFLNRLYQLFAKNDYLFLRYSDENGNFKKIDIRINKNNKDDANLENINSKKVQASLENNCSKNSKPRSKVHKIINKKIEKIKNEKQIDEKKLKLIKFHYYSSLKTSLIFDAHRQVLKKNKRKN